MDANTTYDDIINKFCFKMRNDPDFFYYKNVADEEATKLTKEVCMNYLDEAIAKLLLNGKPDVDFNDRNNIGFNFELTLIEKELLINLMYEFYLKEGINKIKFFSQWYTSKELNTFSPANERNSFIKTYDNIVQKNLSMIKNYISRDRKTGQLKELNYSDGLFPEDYLDN